MGRSSVRKGLSRRVTLHFGDRCAQERSNHRVAVDDLLIEVEREFRGALLGCEVYIGDAEALGEAVAPLEVVEEAPKEVSLHGDSFRHAAMELAEVVAQVKNTVGIEDAAVGSEDVVGGVAVFGDVDLLDAPDLRDQLRGPVDGLGSDEEPV